jgi:predicted transcriptional regulator
MNPYGAYSECMKLIPTTAARAAKKPARNELYQLERRWSSELIAAGWTVLPSVIIDRQLALGLDAIDINILLHLAKHWWQKDNPPHAAKASIAAAMQINVSTVRKRIARMERDGLIHRRARHNAVSGRQETNEYLFDGLIREATPFAREAIQEKQRRKADAAARLTCKRPQLVSARAKQP